MSFQFISYIPTPNDKYIMGIGKVKAFDRIELRYKRVRSKDGSGSFFACASYSLDTESGSKAYTPCFLLDSRSDEEAIMELLKQGAKKVDEATSVHAPSSMDEVADSGQLPF